MGYFTNDGVRADLSSPRGFQVRARHLFSPRADRRTMSLLFAAIGAVITALAEVTFGLYDAVGSATPHLVLVGGVIWTIAAGIDRGITWAFVGGLVLDSLLGRPLGVSSVALLVAVGAAALIAQPFPRLRLVAPIVAVPLMSVVYSTLLLGLTAAVQQSAIPTDPLTLITPGALYDGVLGLFVGPIVVTLRDRRAPTERLDW
jgi:rod shape-determining protein MreD